ncbi:hypothetical protein AAG587_17690 [Vreelandella neptunia]|uniref:hypothetical protein n=1 Tax=Vreelandella neptunia TaxID=115551 RepID=UPI003159CB52
MVVNIKRGVSNSMMKSILINACVERLEGFRKYTEELDAKFQSDKRAIVESYDLSPDKYGQDEDEYNDIIEFISDDIHEIENTFIDTFRKSTLVSLYSFLERQMNLLCKRVEKQNSLPIAVTDLKGEGVVRSKQYLEKMASIDFSSGGMNALWSAISDLNKLRNQIVHEEGYVKRTNPTSRIENIINTTPGLDYAWSSQLKIEMSYIDSTIHTIEQFLSNLYNQAL